MVHSDIFTQARQGDPQAIAALMNHSLQRKQVTVRAALQESRLTIFATSKTPPEAQFMVNFVQRGLERLQPQQITQAIVQGYTIGSVKPLWKASIDLSGKTPPQIITATRSPQTPAPPSASPHTASPHTASPHTAPPGGAAQRSRQPLTPTPRSRSRSETQSQPQSNPPFPPLAPEVTTRSRTSTSLSGANTRIPPAATPPAIATPATRSQIRRSALPANTGNVSDRSRSPLSASPVPLTWRDQILNVLALLAFIVLSVFVVLCASAAKLFTAFLSETSIYRIQFFGDLLQGIEAAEMFNIVVFAILGWGLGFATVFVPRQFGIRVNMLIGLLVFPLLLSVSSVLRYQTWIDEFATTEKLTPTQAISQTDLYLNAKVNQTGFLGFYLHTAKYPGLPTTRVQMDEVDSLEEKAADRMESMIGITPERLSLSFAICMWGIRLFYLALSLLTGISNFAQGVNFADRLGQRS